MLSKSDIEKIKQIAEDFFAKTTIPVTQINTGVVLNKTETGEKEVVELSVRMEEPQILIGQGGQTLFEVQRLLRLILNKKFENILYLNLDINDYKKKKVDYLKSSARDLANEAAFIKKEKALSPMSAYERRVVHAELSDRSDVTTESRGEGPDRHIVIKPR